MKDKLIPIVCIIILPLLSIGQINGNFELWDTTYTHTYESDLLNSGVANALGGNPTNWKSEHQFGITRTTDSYLGNYALIVHTWYHYANETISYKQEISETPDIISGYYKYIAFNESEENTVGYGKVILTNANQDTIALTSFEFDTSSVYTYFEFPINRLTNEPPDSIEIIFTNADYGIFCNELNTVCNFLYLDEIKLSTTTSINDISNHNLQLFPNPVSSDLNIATDIDNFQVIIFDSVGRVVLTHKNIKTLSLVDLAKGVYFVKVISNGINEIRKVVKE